MGADRALLPFLSLLIAVGAGLGWMYAHGAPATYLVLNASALVLAAALACLPLRMLGSTGLTATGIVLLAILAGSLASRGADSVHRWIALGPLQLHAGMLVLPALLIVAARSRELPRTLLLVGSAVVLAAQPDRGTAVAFALGCAAIIGKPRKLADYATGASAAAAVMVTWIRPDHLQPVIYVEYVLAAARQAGGIWLAVLTLALAGAVVGPLFSRTRYSPILTCFWTGLVLASLLGPYPTPLIGYGASPILGYGLALALLGGSRS